MNSKAVMAIGKRMSALRMYAPTRTPLYLLAAMRASRTQYQKAKPTSRVDFMLRHMCRSYRNLVTIAVRKANVPKSMMSTSVSPVTVRYMANETSTPLRPYRREGRGEGGREGWVGRGERERGGRVSETHAGNARLAVGGRE